MKSGWHFLAADRRLRYDDGRIAVDGEMLSYTGAGPPKCCECGMHASPSAAEALAYAPGLTLCFVEVHGDIDEQPDKFCGRHRRILWSVEVPLAAVVDYANWCAARAAEHARVSGSEAAEWAAGRAAGWAAEAAGRAAERAAEWAAEAAGAARRAARAARAAEEAAGRAARAAEGAAGRAAGRAARAEERKLQREWWESRIAALRGTP